MEIVDYSKSGILQHYQRIAGGDPAVFTDGLRRLSEKKLKEVVKGMGLHLAADKASTIKIVVDAVKKEAKKKMKEAATKTTTEENEATAGPAPELATPENVVELKINETFLKAIPRPGKEDKARTKASIEKNIASGKRPLDEKIKVLPDMTIWDGYSRKEILDELGVPITADMIEIEDVPAEDVMLRIYNINVARRHLSDIEKIKAIQPFLPAITAKAKAKGKELSTKRKAIKALKVAETKKAAKAAGKVPPKGPKEAKIKVTKQTKAEKAEAHTREVIAKTAGVAPGQVKLHQWLEKYAKFYYEQEAAKGAELGTIYGVAHDLWWNTVKKYAPDLLEEVKAGRMLLEHAYKQAEPLVPQAEHVAGPFEVLVLKVKTIFLKNRQKKYGVELSDLKLEQDDADFVSSLDALIQKYAAKNQ